MVGHVGQLSGVLVVSSCLRCVECRGVSLGMAVVRLGSSLGLLLGLFQSEFVLLLLGVDLFRLGLMSFRGVVGVAVVFIVRDVRMIGVVMSGTSSLGRLELYDVI